MVMMPPKTNRFCRSAFCQVERSAGAGAGVAGVGGGAHDEIAVLARGVSRIESRSATRFTTT